MKKPEIKTLLEKYYKGETNLEEEGILIEYFAGKNIDSEFISDKEFFTFLIKERENQSSIEDLSEPIWKNIEEYENLNRHKSLKNKILYRITLAIAASLIIAMVSVSIFKYELFTRKNQIQFTDTYNNPELAYIEAKKALLFVSEKLNEGTNHIENLNSFEKGTKDLKLIENFDKGLNELKPVKSIEVVNKYIKNK